MSQKFPISKNSRTGRNRILPNVAVNQSPVRAIIDAMKLLALILLLTPAFALAQGTGSKETAAAKTDDSGLIVVKYTIHRERAAPLRSKSTLPAISGNASDRSINSRSGADTSIGSRNPTVVNAPTPEARDQQIADNSAADIQKVETKADRENRADLLTHQAFRYWVRFDNTTPHRIKMFYWEFDTQESSDPNSPARRQFFCKAEIKPGKMKDIEAISKWTPSYGISATISDNDSARPYEKIVVNRVEYEDGTIWQRPAWKINGNDPAPMFSGTTLTRVRGCIELRNAKTK